MTCNRPDFGSDDDLLALDATLTALAESEPGVGGNRNSRTGGPKPSFRRPIGFTEFNWSPEPIRR